MANYEKHEILALTKEEKSYMAFANLVLAGLDDDMYEKGADYFMDMETGEIIEATDINQAFHVLEFLQGKVEIV